MKQNWTEYGKKSRDIFADCNRIWVYDEYYNVDEVISDNNKSWHNLVFKTEEDCQKYVDWLNENYVEAY